jgi:uncharacterized protein
MSAEMPQVPRGNGKHHIALVVVSANDLAASCAFYSRLFGWRLQQMSPELAAGIPPKGPMLAFRSGFPAGAPGIVPYISVPDVNAMLARIVAAGGAIERAPWSMPLIGTLARFRDTSGTIYGLTDGESPGGKPHVPMPLGTNPKPHAGALCSLEMHAAEGKAGVFFGELFGWNTLATMPQYTAFDAGAGVGGVFQSHTPMLPALGYVYAPDVEATLTQVESAGGQRIGDPMRLPDLGCFGYFKDPSGTTMGLIGE